MIPTIVEIRNQILADIQTALNAPEPLPPRSVWGVLATAVAGAISLVYRFGQWVRRQIFTETMESSNLDRRGSEYGLPRGAARRWRGQATATGNGTLTAGTLIQGDSGVYRVRQQTTISVSGTVELEAVEFGADSNLENGAELEFVTPQPGLDRDLLASSTTQAGLDTEGDEPYRARILQRQRNVPQGGAIPDWIRWTTEVPGIAEAQISRPGLGSITVFPLTDDNDPLNRIPPQSKLDEVLEYITDPKRAPIRAASVVVLPPVEIEFDVDIIGLVPNNATVRENILEAVTAHFFSRRARQYSDEPNPLHVVSAARITSIAIASGADVVTVDLKNAGGTSITDYELSIGELAILRNFVWV